MLAAAAHTATPTPVHNPNGILIGSAVFAGLTITSDRQTTLRQSVTIGRICVGLRCSLNTLKTIVLRETVSKREMTAQFFNKCSAVAEMGDRFGHNRHGPKLEGCAPLGEREVGPYLTQCGQD